jgi:hypothetical protein
MEFPTVNSVTRPQKMNKSIDSVLESILFAEKTVSLSSKNFDDYCTISNLVLSQLHKCCVYRLKRYLGFQWFFANKLALHLYETKTGFYVAPHSTLHTDWFV